MNNGRYWTMLLYLDSCNENWIKILYESGYKVAVSPLHDKDKDENGEFKKQHYHLLFMFNGTRNKKFVLEIAKELNAPLEVKKVNDKQSMYEYLTHKNNLEKYQYNEDDIMHINCKRYDFLEEDYQLILDYIDENKIKSLVKLTQLLRKDSEKRLLKYVSNNTYYINSYINALQKDYDSKIESLIKQLYNNYGDIRINKDVLNKLCEVFNEVKITE